MDEDNIEAIDGDVHIDGRSCTPAQARRYAARIIVSAEQAEEQRTSSLRAAGILVTRGINTVESGV